MLKYPNFCYYRKMKLGNRTFDNVTDKSNLVADVVKRAIDTNRLSDVYVSEIDPTLSDTAAFCEKYEIKPELCANCVVIEAKRAERTWYVACVILANTRADINGVIRKYIDARKVSFAPMDQAVEMTGMEYGAITPIGLPNDRMVLVDNSVVNTPNVIIGSGIRKSKLLVPGKLLSTVPNVVVMEITKSAVLA